MGVNFKHTLPELLFFALCKVFKKGEVCLVNFSKQTGHLLKTLTSKPLLVLRANCLEVVPLDSKVRVDSETYGRPNSKAQIKKVADLFLIRRKEWQIQKEPALWDKKF